MIKPALYSLGTMTISAPPEISTFVITSNSHEASILYQAAAL